MERDLEPVVFVLWIKVIIGQTGIENHVLVDVLFDKLWAVSYTHLTLPTKA